MSGFWWGDDVATMAKTPMPKNLPTDEKPNESELLSQLCESAALLMQGDPYIHNISLVRIGDVVHGVVTYENGSQGAIHHCQIPDHQHQRREP